MQQANRARKGQSNQVRSAHCVGIGGIGMSAIARVLLEQGWHVTGSDLHLSPVARSLIDSGIEVFVGHDASHVGEADVVLISSAIPEHNPEVVEAKQRGIPVLKRSGFLGQLMADKVGVAVAGTHGKTTTTSMIIWILTQASLDPTFIVGGVIESLHANARAGQGPHFVIEADEYDRMFLGLKPTVAAITYLEHDHPDCYPTFDDMRTAFEQFVERVLPGGLIVGCGDQPAVADLLSRVTAIRERGDVVVQTCGLQPGQSWQAIEALPNSVGGHDFQVLCMGKGWGRVCLKVPGLHNVQNALLAVAVADWLGIDGSVICQALATFSGVGRRFQVLGEAGGVTVVDDYGHHPTEIRATLAASKARYGARPLWAVFQPHTYSRTKALWAEFTNSFELASRVIVLDIYAARETDTLGVSAADLAAQMRHPNALHIAALDDAAAHILSHVEPDAVIITLSAGDGNWVGKQVLETLRERSLQSDKAS